MEMAPPSVADPDSGSGIWDTVPFGPLDPGTRKAFSDPGNQTHIFETLL
jgi:hypothetical protein